MAATLPVGHWSWHERWLYPDQIRDLPDRPQAYVLAQQNYALRQQMMGLPVVDRNALTSKPQSLFEAAQQQQQHQQQASFTPRPPSSHQFQPQPPSHANPSSHTPQFSSQAATTATAAAPTFRLDLQPVLKQQEEEESKQNGFVDYNPIGRHLAANNPQAFMNTQNPSVPRRYRDGTFRRTTSEYCYTFRDPGKYAAELGVQDAQGLAGSKTARDAAAALPQATPGSRLPHRDRGYMAAPKDFQHHHFYTHYHETAEQRAKVRPEQHSFRLWGRINNAHCVVPYETESQRAFALEHVAKKDPLDRTFFMKVEKKDYKDAFAKANAMRLIRGGGGESKKQ